MNPPEEKSSGTDSSKKSPIRNFLSKPIVKSDSRYVQYSGLGIQLAAVILIFLWVGIKLDEWLNTNPWFTLALTLIGFSAGFYSFYLNIKKLGDQDKADKNKAPKSYKKF